MIDLYFSATPNGLKLKLFFAETGLAHRVIPMRLSKGDQFKPDYVALFPNSKMPALVDHDPSFAKASEDEPSGGGEPLALFESGALLLYLAEKTGRFLSPDPRTRAETLTWLFWQMGGLGPMAGQAGYFRVYAPEKIPFAIERYTRETRRLYAVMDTRLAQAPYLGGDDYSIADMACYPWIVPHVPHGQDLDEHPNLKRWFHMISARPAVIAAYTGVECVYGSPGSPVAVAAL